MISATSFLLVRSGCLAGVSWRVVRTWKFTRGIKFLCQNLLKPKTRFRKNSAVVLEGIYVNRNSRVRYCKIVRRKVPERFAVNFEKKKW